MKTSSPGYILTFMIIICVVFGTGIATVNYMTQGLLRKNEALFKNRGLCKAFMLDVAGTTSLDYEKSVAASLRSDTLRLGDRVTDIYTNTVDSAIGFIFRGIGFWDAIVGILVLENDLSKIKNIRILTQSETPGLGARIEETWFTDQFRGLTIDWDAGNDERIIIGPSPRPNLTNRVDAITGATQTSLALMKTLNRELTLFRQTYSQRMNDHGR